MSLKKFLKTLEKYKIIIRRPRPVYVFLLTLAYFLIWLLSFVLYLKYDMKILEIWIIIIGVLTLISLIHSILHLIMVRILGTEEVHEMED